MRYDLAYTEQVPVPEAFFTGNYRYLFFGAIWQNPDPEDVAFAQEVNRLAKSTVEAVQNATTDEQLVEAIRQRAEFIRNRVKWYTDYIKRKTGEDLSGLSGVQTVGTLATLIPLPGFSQVGKILSSLALRDDVRIAQEDANWAKGEIEKYAKDATQLAQLYSETVAANTSTTTGTGTTDTTSNAATPISTAWYVAGAGLLILILIYLKSRQKRRKK